MFLRCVLVLGCLHGMVGMADDSQKQTDQPVVTARFGEKAMDSGARQVFVSSDTELKNVEIKSTDVDESRWTALPKASGSDAVYATELWLEARPGRKFMVRAVLPDGSRFYNAVETSDVEEPFEVAFDSLESKEKVDAERKAPIVSRPASQSSGSSYPSTAGNSPQAVAQSRANEMARRGQGGHLNGNGVVRTSQGTLFEGVGWGTSSMPGTCVSKDGSAPVADAVARGGNGMTYRVRLYRTGTVNRGGR